MALPFKIEKLEDVPEALRGEYKKEGDFYVLDVTGAVDKSKVDEFRTNNNNLKRELEKFKDVDPEAYKKMVADAQLLKDKGLLDAGKIDELIESRINGVKTSFEGQLTKLQSEKEALNTQLSTLLIDNEVTRVAATKGVRPDALNMLGMLAKQTFTIGEDGKPVAKNGDQILFGKDGVSGLSIEEFIDNTREVQPFLFESSSGGGGGGQGGGGSGKSINKTDIVNNVDKVISGEVTVNQ